MTDLKVVGTAKRRRHLYCSFCGKNEDDVKHMMCGAASVAICNECVAVASQQIAVKERKDHSR